MHGRCTRHKDTHGKGDKVIERSRDEDSSSSVG